VPFSTVVRLKESVQPSSLPRFQQLNAATISLLPAAGVSLGDAKDILDQIAKETFPQGYSADYAGELRQYVKEGSSLIGIFGLAIVVIFLILSALYENFRDPFIVLMTVPLAMTGAMIFIFLGSTTINIYTQVGLLTLVGLISKHGILIVEFANQLRETKGLSKREAIEEAAALRLRPVLMTAFATVAGVIPLLFAHGPGAVSRFSIGVVIASGMSIGTLFTLFVVPAFYLLVSKEHKAQVEAPAES
jgi:multidrug efflux pump